MITYDQWQEFQQYIIAQDDDDCGYSESGFVVAVKDGVAAISHYSHCSCYGTVSCLGGLNLSSDWDWSGTEEQLQQMAAEIRDPNMPERSADPSDYDYDHLMRVYDDVLAHYGLSRKVGIANG